MKKIILAVVAVSLFISCTTSEKKEENTDTLLELKLTGKKYDKLVMTVPITGTSLEPTDAPKIEGASTDGYNWTFIIPDSIQSKSQGFLISMVPADQSTKLSHQMAFSTKNSAEKKGIWRLYDKKTVLNAAYWETETDTIRGDSEIDNLIYQIDFFDVAITDDMHPEMKLQLMYPDLNKIAEENYDQELQKRIDLAKEYPDSQYLMMVLAYTSGFKSKADMQKVFENFSAENKNSDIGKRVSEYLASGEK